MSQKRFLRVGIAAALLIGGATIVGMGPARAASGDLDPTFGGDGTVSTGPLTPGERPNRVVTQPDGKVLVLSTATTDQTSHFVTRFNADGSLDTGFGTGGTAAVATGDYVVGGLLVTSAGDIVLVGERNTGADYSPGSVIRLTPAGQPDAGFGTNGRVLLDDGDAKAFLNLTVAFEQNGGLVVVGTKGTAGSFAANWGVYAARLTATGTLDGTFGTGGQSFTDDIPPSGVCGMGVGGAAAQPDGSTMIATVIGCGTGSFFGVYQLGGAGALASLNDNLDERTGASITGAVPLPGGGMLIVANAIQEPIGSSNLFMQVTAAGQLGPVLTEDSLLAVNDVAALPDGRIATSAAVDGEPTGALQVRSISGQPDASFASGGVVKGAALSAVAAAPDNKIVTVGGTGSIDLARYQLSGAAPVQPELTPVTPARILDTRSGLGYSGPKPVADSTITVQIAGRGGVPTTGAAAVVLNVTATQADGPGFVTVWPSDQPRPLASNLNLSSVGQTIPNLVTVPLGADGAVKMYTLAGVHLIADVAAWFPAGAGFTPLTPARILDTRSGLGYSGPKPGAGATVDVVVAGQGGVAADATAVVMNVTATEADAPGFVTAWPTGSPRPNASNLNLTHAGQTIPNQVMVPLGTNGSVSLFTFAGSHLVADVAGYFTAGGGFTPLSPDRILDTRSPAIGYTGAKPGAGATIAVQVAGVGGVPATGATAVVMNVTATEADAAGFVTAWPSGAPQPLASNLNLDAAGQTIANLVLVPIGPDGKVLLYTMEGTHLVADVAGYIS